MSKRFTLQDIQRLETKGIRAKATVPVQQVNHLPEIPANESTGNEKKVFLLGIDPDVDRCGVAIKEMGTAKILDVKALHFYDVLNLINHLSKDADLRVYIDAGWLIDKSNWHQARGAGSREKIAKNVGACHQVGKLICSYLQRKRIEYHEVKPSKAKVSAEEFKRLNLWKGRINQDMRDAIMLILHI